MMLVAAEQDRASYRREAGREGGKEGRREGGKEGRREGAGAGARHEYSAKAFS